MSSNGYVWYVGSFKLCCEILLLLDVAGSDMDCLVPCSFSGCVESLFVVHSAQDVGMV